MTAKPFSVTLERKAVRTRLPAKGIILGYALDGELVALEEK